jgi:hypothetical protein
MPVEDPTDLDWYIDNVVVPSGIERRPVGPVLAWQGLWAALANQLTQSAGDSPLARAITLAVAQGFVLTSAQLRRCGLPAATARRLVRRGEWTSCGHGTVAVVPAQRAAANEYDQVRRAHALRTAAAALVRQRQVASTASAAILHGLPTFDVPNLPELNAGTSTTAGRLAAAHVRVTALRPDEIETWFGVPVTVVGRTIVDLARVDPRSGLMAADAALHEGLLRKADLDPFIDRSAGLPGIRRARQVLQLASHLIESPLESITHLALQDDGFPPPGLQKWVRGADGTRYRVDFLWPGLRLIVEADGRGKNSEAERWREKKRDITL